jgi:hypothetical protein
LRGFLGRDLLADVVQRYLAHALLERGNFELAAVDHRLAAGGVGSGKVERSFMVGGPASVHIGVAEGLTIVRVGIDPVSGRSLAPFGFHLRLVVSDLRQPRLQGGDLGGPRTFMAELFHLALDVLAALGEGHHLIAGVALDFPSRRAYPVHPVAEALHFV